MFDVLIIGGGAAGMQCALVLGSALTKPYAANKSIGIVMHQKASHLQSALLNNVLGITPGTTGADILETGRIHLKKQYPQVHQILNEKTLEVTGEAGNFEVKTNKGTWQAAQIVIALGYTNLFNIKGLTQYIEPHKLSPPEKERIQLKNTAHLVNEGIWVAGTLAGYSSQFAIAAGSGAMVATQILTMWNGGKPTKVHDKTEG